ncbi:MAG: transposase [Comamonadaceae bacterium]|nr:transposase [Comamonadaceae bacterium]
MPDSQVPTAAFGELYHERWRIEEAFKRLKHRCKLESVSGLTQHALMVDVHAKVLADNLAFGVHGRVSGSGFTGQAAYM